MKTDGMWWKIETMILIFLLGIVLGSGAGHYVTDWWHSYKHADRIDQHRARCFEDDRYIRYIGYDSTGAPLCFQQSKRTWKIERTTLIYPE